MMAVSSDFLIVEPPAAGMQRLRAHFSGHAYDRHRHETYAVGVTEAGLQCFHYRGAARASTAGRVVVLHPDEAHDGHSGAPGGFTYRMLYADPSLIAAALGGRALPFVAVPVFDDPILRRVVADAFVDFPKPIEDLAIPALFAALADALARLAGAPSVTRRLPAKALDTARDLLDVASGPVRSATLEAETGRGVSLADAAYAAGFADQSHMTRHFKARFGLPPGRYAALSRGAAQIAEQTHVIARAIGVGEAQA